MAELLSFYKFPGDEIPIVRGSALAALQGNNDEIGKNAILKLMEAVDNYIPTPERQKEKAFLMPIEDVFSIAVFNHNDLKNFHVFKLVVFYGSLIF